jgi:hypothetical protein
MQPDQSNRGIMRSSATTGASMWDRPTLTNPTTVTLSATTYNLKLGAGDYILSCAGQTVPIPGKLAIWGGHNVIIENCDFNITDTNWAGFLGNQTGTLWLSNVHFGGASLTGGVQMQEPGTTTVVMRDVVFDTVHGSRSTNHAECIATWSGPQQFLIDGLVCPTTYQGLFLLPNQWDWTTTETTWDFRNVEIDGVGAFDLWLGDVQPSNLGTIPTLNVQNVYDCGTGEPRDYDGTSDGGKAWANVKPCPTASGGKPAWLTGNPAAPVMGVDEPHAPAPLGGE